VNYKDCVIFACPFEEVGYFIENITLFYKIL